MTTTARRHALVVDDSTIMRKVLKAHLKTLGFDVTEAVNGLDALAQLRDMERADVLLVDWNMPEMDGITFVRAVRAGADYTSVPVMMVTTNSDHAHVSQALAAGANEYIKKPFTSTMFREKLEILGLLGAARC